MEIAGSFTIYASYIRFGPEDDLVDVQCGFRFVILLFHAKVSKLDTVNFKAIILIQIGIHILVGVLVSTVILAFPKKPSECRRLPSPRERKDKTPSCL